MIDYTLKYRDDGILLNADANLPFIDVTSIQGLDMPEFRSAERVREGIDGGFVDAQYMNARTIVISGNVYANPTDVGMFLSQLKANFAPSKTAQPLYFSLPGLGDLILFCKSLGVKYDLDALISSGTSAIQIQLKAEDPNMYSEITISKTVSLGDATAKVGRGYNKSYARGYGSTDATAPGIMQLEVGGTKNTTGVIRLELVSQPVVYNDSVNKRLALATTIVPGNYLDLDLRNRSVMFNGSMNKGYDILPGSQWFDLSPGVNYLRITGAVVQGGTRPKMTVTYRNAYY